MQLLPDSDEAVSRRCAVPGRDSERRGAGVPRGGAGGGGPARRARPPGLAGQRRVPSDRRRARLDGTGRMAAADVEISLFARPNAAWDTSAMARASRGRSRRTDLPWARAGRAGTRGRQARCCPRDPQRADRRPRSAFGLRRDAGGRRASGGHAGEGLGDAARREPGGCARARRSRCNTINLPTDLTLPQIAAIRAAVDMPARPLRRGARQHRRFRSAARDSGDHSHRRARLREVRPSQCARCVSGGHASRGDHGCSVARARAARDGSGSSCSPAPATSRATSGARRFRSCRAGVRGGLSARWRDRSRSSPASGRTCRSTESGREGGGVGFRRARARLLGRPLRGRQGACRSRLRGCAARDPRPMPGWRCTRSAHTSLASASAIRSTSVTGRSCRRRCGATASPRACGSAPRSG